MFTFTVKDVYKRQWKDGVVFAILIVVLLVKPTGILGRPITEKV